MSGGMRWQLAAGVAALVAAPAWYVAAAPGAVSEYEKASEGDVSCEHIRALDAQHAQGLVCKLCSCHKDIEDVNRSSCMDDVEMSAVPAHSCVYQLANRQPGPSCASCSVAFSGHHFVHHSHRIHFVELQCLKTVSFVTTRIHSSPAYVERDALALLVFGTFMNTRTQSIARTSSQLAFSCKYFLSVHRITKNAN